MCTHDTRNLTHAPVTLTKYQHGKNTFLDALPLMRKVYRSNKPTTIYVTPGNNDITNWRYITKQYGYSYIRINSEPATILRERKTNTINTSCFTIYIDKRDFKKQPRLLEGMHCGDIYVPGDSNQLQDKLACVTDTILLRT